MKTFKEYVGDTLVYISIAFWLWVLYFWIRVIFLFMEEEDYETLIFFLVLSGIIVVIVGYYIKWYVYGRSIAGSYIVEYFQKLREKQKLEERIPLNEKIDLWILDGYGVKVCNMIGITLIFIGIILFAYIKFHN